MSKLKNVEVPTLGESVSEAVIATWHKSEGEDVATDDLLVELETDKVTLEINSPTKGKLFNIKVKEGDVVYVGDILADIDEDAKTDVSINKKTEIAEIKKINAEQKLSPAPRKIIADNNLQAKNIEGTGKDARITKGDVIKHLNNPSINEKKVNIKELEEIVPMSRLRQRIAQRLKESQNTAAILTTFNEIDMTEIMQFRSIYKDKFLEKHGCKLGFMSLFSKACVAALQEIPTVNAEISGTNIIYKNHYDIGVAVGTEQGLVVPIVKNCDKLSIAGIEKEILHLAGKARDGKLAIEDLTGGTFTISNGGVYGSLLSTPIINPPQSGILGMHSIQDKPAVIKGEIKIRKMMYIALSYDHRIVDGKEAVTFLVKVKEYIEDPRRLLLEI